MYSKRNNAIPVSEEKFQNLNLQKIAETVLSVLNCIYGKKTQNIYNGRKLRILQ
jgi:hypothetical protein